MISKRKICNQKYRECKFYTPTNPVNSRCVRNGVMCSCEIEQEYLEKFSIQVNEYFKNNLK